MSMANLDVSSQGGVLVEFSAALGTGDDHAGCRQTTTLKNHAKPVVGSRITDPPYPYWILIQLAPWNRVRINFMSRTP